jgi:predicted amidophosphoribosyltransferase
MAKILPTTIQGPWRAGFVLDYHTISTRFMGRDSSGRPIYDNKYTELGSLLHKLKYDGEESAVTEIAGTVVGFLATWRPPVTMIVPMPPSRARRTQPVVRLAFEIGKRLGMSVSIDAVKKVERTPQLKDISDFDSKCNLLATAFRVRGPVVSGQQVLLLDDLYDSGATMYSVTKALCAEGSVAEVYVLALTRTRRMKR